MMLSFASFVKRVDEDRVKLRFLIWNGEVFDRYVDRELTKTANQQRYTDEQWNSFHFEDMRFQPCVFIGQSLKIAMVFVPLEERNVRRMIENSYPSRPSGDPIFTEKETSEAWINLCKQYDPNLEKVITEATAKKIGINIPKTDLMIERINALIDSFVDDSWAGEHLKDGITDILKGEKSKGGFKPDEPYVNSMVTNDFLDDSLMSHIIDDIYQHASRRGWERCVIRVEQEVAKDEQTSEEKN